MEEYRLFFNKEPIRKTQVYSFTYATKNKKGKKIIYNGEIKVVEGNLKKKEEPFKIMWKGKIPENIPDDDTIYDEFKLSKDTYL